MPACLPTWAPGHTDVRVAGPQPNLPPGLPPDPRRWAIGMSHNRATSSSFEDEEPNIYKKGPAFGMPGVLVDGMDVLKVRVALNPKTIKPYNLKPKPMCGQSDANVRLGCIAHRERMPAYEELGKSLGINNQTQASAVVLQAWARGPLEAGHPVPGARWCTHMYCAPRQALNVLTGM